MENKKKKIDANMRMVALKYDPSDIAPKVVGKGQGYVAEKLIEQAKQNKVPVYKDPKLLQDLMMLNLGENIPPELYEIVAQVLIFISDIDQQQSLLNKS